jgi:hypothetical protein
VSHGAGLGAKALLLTNVVLATKLPRVAARTSGDCAETDSPSENAITIAS